MGGDSRNLRKKQKKTSTKRLRNDTLPNLKVGPLMCLDGLGTKPIALIYRCKDDCLPRLSANQLLCRDHLSRSVQCAQVNTGTWTALGDVPTSEVMNKLMVNEKKRTRSPQRDYVVSRSSDVYDK